MALGEDHVAAAWDANAATWVEHVRAGYDLYREAFTMPAFLAFCPDLDGLRVIDLGCGEGHNTRALARRGAKMTGVDLSPRMIAAARASELALPLGIAYQVGSFTRLEFCADVSFDGAVSTMALMDSPDFGAAARAAHRVLRPGGGFSVQRAPSLLRHRGHEMAARCARARDQPRGRRLFLGPGLRRALAVLEGARDRRC